jgi:nucleoside-diphosphate-sugar epimerase
VDEMISPHVAILEACRITQAKRLVWASSAAVYGRVHDYPRLPVANDAPHMPVTVYGAAKSFLERLSSHYTARYHLDTLGLRFPLVYGPGRRRGGGQFTTHLIEGAALGKRCEVPSADTKHDWLYVADASRCVCMGMRAGALTTRALTVCGQVATTREVGDMLRAWFPDAELVMAEGADDLDFDPTPALNELGYAPAVPLRDGILATANAARQRSGLRTVR